MLLLLFVYVARDFSKACALVSSEFYWGLWLGYGWMVFSLHFDHFFFVLLTCLLSELMKRLHIDRHLAAKIRTISVALI